MRASTSVSEHAVCQLTWHWHYTVQRIRPSARFVAERSLVDRVINCSLPEPALHLCSCLWVCKRDAERSEVNMIFTRLIEPFALEKNEQSDLEKRTTPIFYTHARNHGKHHIPRRHQLTQETHRYVEMCLAEPQRTCP